MTTTPERIGPRLSARSAAERWASSTSCKTGGDWTRLELFLTGTASLEGPARRMLLAEQHS